MSDILYLVHRIPYPPRKGDKVRSYHILKQLTNEYRVHLGTFVDDPTDLKYRPVVSDLCASLHAPFLSTRLARIRSLRGLASGEPLTLKYFFDRSLQHWVNQTLARHAIRKVLVFSSSMAQYAPVSNPESHQGMRRVIDFVDVDSEKWRDYAAGLSGVRSWIFNREARLLLARERAIAEAFDASVFVSRQEADLFRRLAPESAPRITHISNGVDSEYFDPAREFPNPYTDAADVLVFTGAMDYRANIDAVCWFSESVFVKLRARLPRAEFFIVGANPAPAVRKLQNHTGITVTGTVEDVRPYVAHARLAVAPLRVARGVQNKVLEAMAMNKIVVATSAAMEGIEEGHGYQDYVRDTPESMLELLENLLTDPHRLPASQARQFISKHYNWSTSTKAIIKLLEADTSSSIK